jgi:hypothetical protein
VSSRSLNSLRTYSCGCSIENSGGSTIEVSFSQEGAMSAIDQIAEVFQMPDEEMADEEMDKDFDWESNKDDENPEQLPWPDENEAKE